LAVLKLGVVGSGREKTPLSRLRKEVIILSDSTRTPLQIQCAFNGFCKKVLKREAINAHRDAKRYRKHYVCFSDLTFKELNQLHTIQMQMSNENRGKYILAGGKKITPELLYKAIEAKKGELIKNASYNRSIPVYGRYDAFSLFLDYEFSAFIIVILLIFVFSSTYSNEKATGTDRIIKSCGRAGSTFIAKQLTMLCFVVATVILFAIIDLIGLGFYYGLEFIEQPLYAIQDYQFTPLNISIGMAVILSCLFKIFALAFIGEVIILISTLTKNTGAAIVLCFGVIGAMIFASPYIPEHLNPFTLISTKKLISDFEFVNVLGNPVPLYIAAPIIALLLTLILAAVCYIRTSPAKRKAKEVKAV